MNYVEKMNLFGVEAMQIPCLKGAGAPTVNTEGAVGCLYMDTATGELYKCTATSDSGYTWKALVTAAADSGFVMVTLTNMPMGLSASHTPKQVYNLLSSAKTKPVLCYVTNVIGSVQGVFIPYHFGANVTVDAVEIRLYGDQASDSWSIESI